MSDRKISSDTAPCQGGKTSAQHKPLTPHQRKPRQRPATATREASPLKRAQADALAAYLRHRCPVGRRRVDACLKCDARFYMGLSAAELRQAIDTLVALKKIHLWQSSAGVVIQLEGKVVPLPWITTTGTVLPLPGVSS